MTCGINLRGSLTGLFAVFVFGCTAGNITDEGGQAIDIGYGSLVSFIPVDSAGNPILEGPGVYKHYFGFTNSDSTFSFDPSVASSPNYQGSGRGNTQKYLPEGNYFVDVVPNMDIPGTPRDDYVSPIFPHSYDHTCTDFFTQKDILCAIYRFRLYSSNFPSNPKGIMVDGIVHSLPLKRMNGAPVAPPGKITGFAP